MICKNCGKEIEEGIKFCKFCGEEQSEYIPGKDIPPIVGEKEEYYKGETASFTYIEDDTVKMNSGGAPDDYEDAKKKGTVSMILGIVSCGCLFLSVFGCIASVVTGIIGLVKGTKARKVLVDPDRGKSTAGFILSIIGLSLGIIILIATAIFLLFAVTSTLNIGDNSNDITDLIRQIEENETLQDF